MIAEVIINSTVKSLNKTFDYKVPQELVGTIKIGDRILVPFGNSKSQEEGFVVGFKEQSSYQVKEISKIQEGFSLSEEKIQLAKWMAQRYFCNIADAIKMMLPPGTSSKIAANRVKEKSMRFVYLKKDFEEIEKEIEEKKIKSAKHIRALIFLKENEGVLTSDLELFADVSSSILKTLEKNGYIEIVEKRVNRNPFFGKKVNATQNLELTKEQKNAFDEVKKSIDQCCFDEFLLYGITGSRKDGNLFTIN